jgi:transposase InsO family protein
MMRGEVLRLDAALSPRLRSHLPALQAICSSWFSGAKTVSIQSPDTPAAALPPGRTRACFFSGGVDSFYTLLKDNERAPDERQYPHLVFVVGFDLRPEQAELIEKLQALVSAVGLATGRGTVRVSTNLRDFTDGVIPWDHMHGAALAAVGQVLSGVFDSIGIPASLPYARLHPFGSHALLDPLWSGSALELLQDGAELNRSQKIDRWIARSPLALRHLRVCWENRNGRFNCGVCEKCVRTKLALYAADALESCATMDSSLTPWRIFLATWPLASGNYVHAAENLRHLRRRRTLRRRVLALPLQARLAMVRTLLAWRVIRGRFGVVSEKPPGDGEDGGP